MVDQNQYQGTDEWRVSIRQNKRNFQLFNCGLILKSLNINKTGLKYEIYMTRRMFPVFFGDESSAVLNLNASIVIRVTRETYIVIFTSEF